MDLTLLISLTSFIKTVLNITEVQMTVIGWFPSETGWAGGTSCSEKFDLNIEKKVALTG